MTIETEKNEDGSLVLCVPNFSEGRDRSKIEAVVQSARAVSAVRVLDVESDADHNRTVLTFAASPEAALKAASAVAASCVRLIDLTRHKGEHPRMGAVDVIPFIPISGITLPECAQLARRLGENLGRELDLPVYLYGEAASRPERRDLANVRKGQFEGLREEIGKNPERDPDFGPRRIHPTAGAVAVGARAQIVNFNVNLSTSDMSLAREIAVKVRTSGGGLPALRAKEILLAQRNQAQISTVLTDFKTTPLARVLGEIARMAALKGASVSSCELVGLVPREALVDFAAESLRLESFDPKVQILEERLARPGADSGSQEPESAPGSWVEAARILGKALASPEPTPGGGSAAAAAGLMGTSLALMAARISLKSAKTPEGKRSSLRLAETRLSSIQEQFNTLPSRDAESFEGFRRALRLPKDDPQRSLAMEQALLAAAAVPLETVQAAREAHEAARELDGLVLEAVSSDLRCAFHLLNAAAASAAENVRINLKSLKDSNQVREMEKSLSRSLSAFSQTASL